MRSLNRFGARLEWRGPLACEDHLAQGCSQARRPRYYVFRALAIAAIAWAGLDLALCAGEVLNETGAKIQFLHYVAQYAVWPKEALAPSDKQFVIGVLGENPFGDALENYFKGRSVKGRQFVIKFYKEIEEIKNCQILFISSSEKSRFASILKQLEDRAILTISDSDGFIQKEGMIYIYIVPKSEITGGLAWEINPKVMKREKLQIDPFFIERARTPNH